jgi:hypothetical protein
VEEICAHFRFAIYNDNGESDAVGREAWLDILVFICNYGLADVQLFVDFNFA